MFQVSPSVLVVEDDRSVARVLRIALAEGGFAVREVASGAEALVALSSDPTDAVVLDLGLPDGRGRAVLQWLQNRSEPEYSRPVCVAISALNREEAASIHGLLDEPFLGKPFDPWELVRILQELLLDRQGRPLSL